MTAKQRTAPDNTSSPNLGLVYFKPAGAIFQRTQLLEKLLASTVAIEIHHRMDPIFDDNMVIPTIVTTSELHLRVDMNLSDSEGLLDPNASPASFQLLDHTLTVKRSLNLNTGETLTDDPVAPPEPQDEAAAEAPPPVKRGRGRPSKAQIEAAAEAPESSDLLLAEPIVRQYSLLASLGSFEAREAINECSGLRLLKAVRNPVNPEKTLRAAFFTNLAAEVNNYEKCTSFILEAETKLVTTEAEEEAAAAQPAAAVNSLLSDDSVSLPSAAPVMASITQEQLDLKRDSRQESIDLIREAFTVNNRLVYTVSMAQLPDMPDLAGVVQGLVNSIDANTPVDVFLGTKIAELISSAIVNVG